MEPKGASPFLLNCDENKWGYGLQEETKALKIQEKIRTKAYTTNKTLILQNHTKLLWLKIGGNYFTSPQKVLSSIFFPSIVRYAPTALRCSPTIPTKIRNYKEPTKGWVQGSYHTMPFQMNFCFCTNCTTSTLLGRYQIIKSNPISTKLKSIHFRQMELIK